MKTIPLQKLSKLNRIVIGKLPGLKSIIRVKTQRLVKWYLVSPAVGEGDAACVLLDQVKWSLSGMPYISRRDQEIFDAEKERIAAK